MSPDRERLISFFDDVRCHCIALVGEDLVHVGADVCAVDSGIVVVEVCEGQCSLGGVKLCNVPSKASNNTTNHG